MIQRYFITFHDGSKGLWGRSQALKLTSEGFQKRYNAFLGTARGFGKILSALYAIRLASHRGDSESFSGVSRHYIA